MNHRPLGRLSSKFRPAPSKVLQGHYQELEDDPTRALLCHGSNGDDEDESTRHDCYPYYYETLFSSPRQQQQQVSCWDFEPDWSQLAEIIQQGQHGPSMKTSPFIGNKMKRTTRRLAFNRLLCYRHRGAQADDDDEMEVKTHVSLPLDDAAPDDFFLDHHHHGPLLLTISTPLSHMVTVIQDGQGRGGISDDFSLSLRSGSTTGNDSAMMSQARSASDETMDAIAKLSSPYVYQQASQPQQQGILLVAQTAAQRPTVVSMQKTEKRQCCIINPLDMELFLRKGQQEKKNRKNKKYWNNGKAQVEKWSDDNNDDDDDVSSISSASTGSTSGKRRLF